MSVRISTTLDLIAGIDNSLDHKIFGGNSVLSEVLDTLEHGGSNTYLIKAGEAEQLDFGDITEVRYVYIEGDGEFSIAFAAMLATAAEINGAGGTYPTSFDGNESPLLLEIDGTPVTVQFLLADQTRDQVIARINFEASLAGFVADPVSFPNVADLDLISPTTGLSSEVRVLVGSDAAVLTALGLVVSDASGEAAEPGTTDVEVRRPVDPAGANAAFGVKAYFMGTVKASALTIRNLQSDVDLNLTVFLAGDLVSTP